MLYYAFDENGFCTAKAAFDFESPGRAVVASEINYPDLALLELVGGKIRERKPPDAPEPKDEIKVIEEENEDPATVDTLAAIAGLYELLAEMEQKGA